MFIRFLRCIILGLMSLFVLLPAAAAERGKKFVLVIDPGHGGHDPGAVGRISKEKTINLKVALEFGRLVEANCPDVKVLYTRKTDKFISLQGRADFANRNKADLFISIHTNALPKGKIAYGTETYTLGMARATENLEVAKRENSVITLEKNYEQTYAGFDPRRAESYIIFELMQDTYMKQSVDLADCIQRQYKRCGRRNKGVHQAGLLVLRNTSMPSVLTELGFISTPAEEQYMNTAQGVRELARSIYNGFVQYRKKHGGEAAPLQPVKEAPEAPEPPAPAPKTPPAKAEVLPISPKMPPASAETPAETEEAKSKAEEAKSKAEEAQPEAAEAGHPVFKVQFLTAGSRLKEGHRNFKGLTNVDCYLDGKTYKYTYGSSASYNEIKKVRREVAKKFPEAFIVAFIDGKRTALDEAIRRSQNK